LRGTAPPRTEALIYRHAERRLVPSSEPAGRPFSPSAVRVSKAAPLLGDADVPTARFVHVMHNHGRPGGEYCKESIQ
jgi:hypothetical protein